MASAVHFSHLNGGGGGGTTPLAPRVHHHCQVHQNPYLAQCIYIGLLIFESQCQIIFLHFAQTCNILLHYTGR